MQVNIVINANLSFNKSKFVETKTLNIYLDKRKHQPSSITANLREFTSNFRLAVYIAGVLDAQAGHAYPERGRSYVHVGPEVHGEPSKQFGELDSANQIAAEARLRRVRVSGQHRAEDVAQLYPQRSR